MVRKEVRDKKDLDQLQHLGIDEYFLYPQINWEPKSISINRIAEMLNVNIDSFALIDDSTFEREQVASQFSQVRVYDEGKIESLVDRSLWSAFSIKNSINYAEYIRSP